VVVVVVVTAVTVTVTGGTPCDGTPDADLDCLNTLVEAHRLFPMLWERRRRIRSAVFIAIKMVMAGELRQAMRHTMIDIVSSRRVPSSLRSLLKNVEGLKEVIRRWSSS
jgi:hypothetical protein